VGWVVRGGKGSLNDGQIQNPSNLFGIVPLSNFVPRGFGFVHHSIAILDHEVPNPNLTIRNFLIAVGASGGGGARVGWVVRGGGARKPMFRSGAHDLCHPHCVTMSLTASPSRCLYAPRRSQVRSVRTRRRTAAAAGAWEAWTHAAAAAAVRSLGDAERLAG
jgi:hypothetical protein